VFSTLYSASEIANPLHYPKTQRQKRKRCITLSYIPSTQQSILLAQKEGKTCSSVKTPTKQFSDPYSTSYNAKDKI
jgi:hypothetical protein